MERKWTSTNAGLAGQNGASLNRSSRCRQAGASIAGLLVLLLIPACPIRAKGETPAEASARHEAFLSHWGERTCSLAKLDSDVRVPVSLNNQYPFGPQMKNANVIEMTRRGDPEDVILSVIEDFPGPFDLSATGRASLKRAGVSGKVLDTMQRLVKNRESDAKLVAFLSLQSVAEAMCRAEKQAKLSLQRNAATGAAKSRYAAVYTQLVDLQTERESYLKALGGSLHSNSLCGCRGRRSTVDERPFRREALRTQVFLLQSHLLGLAQSLNSLEVNLDVRLADANNPSTAPARRNPTETHAIDWVPTLSRWGAGDFGLQAALNGRALEKSINAFKDLLEAKYPELASEARLHLEEVEMESNRPAEKLTAQAAL